MGTLTLEVAALGLAAAFTSPTSVLAAIALVSMSDGVRRGLAFLAGRVLAIGVLALFLVFVLQGQDFRAGHTPSQAASAVEIALGGLLLILAAHAYRRRGERTDNGSASKWLDRAERSSWLLGGVVGAILLSYTLTLAAGAEILKTNLGTLEESLAAIVFAVTSTTLVAVPVAVALVAPERSAQVLARWKAWLLTNSRVVAAIGLVLVGAFLIVKATYDLAAG